MREECVKVAIMGADHSANNLSAEDLLRYFARQHVQSRAGYIPPKTAHKLLTAPLLSERPLCDSRTLQQFWDTYDNYQYTLLSPWIKTFGEANLRLPGELIPYLIEQKMSYPYLLSLFGEHLVWLMQAVQNENELRINKYSKDDSSPFLSWHRYHPDEALIWLNKHWEQLEVKQQEAYLNMLLMYPNEQDIPLLKQIFQSTKNKLVLFYASYLLSLLNPQIIQALIDSILNLTQFACFTDYQVPVFDFSWSDIFASVAIQSQEESWNHIVAANGELMDMEQLLQLVPMDRWCEHWVINPQKLLEAAYNSRHTSLFFSAWKKRIVAEKHQAFALTMLSFSEEKCYLEVKLKLEDFLEIFPFAYLQNYVDEQLQKNKEKRP